MAKWTLAFIILCTIIFFLEPKDPEYPGSFYIDTKNPMNDIFSFTPALALERPWTFVTSIFLHADFTHLLFNMFALFMFGIILENKIGPRNFVILFLLSGIFGSVGYMITDFGSSVPAIGASGAIYGIIGALAAMMPFMIVWVTGIIPMPMVAFAFIWAIIEFLGLFSPGDIAHGAHLGGIFVGILYGIYLRKNEKKEFRKYLSSFS
jgi:membrane associated rhomboid family serine protease